MADSEQEKETTIPKGLSLTARDYASEDTAQLVGSNVLGLVQYFGQHIDLATLDGVTIAYDYDQALLDLDRGTKTQTELTASKDWAFGVGMTPAVLRDGQVKSHIVLNAAILEGLLEEPDSDLCQDAVHLIAHECAHVEVEYVFDRQFPGRTLQTVYPGWFDHLKGEATYLAWNEYAVCRICAGFGSDPGTNYETVFLGILKEAEENVRNAIFRYRHNSDLDGLVAEAQRNIGNLIKYASYVLGNADAYGRENLTDHKSLSEALEGNWFKPFFERLWSAHRAVWDRYGRWESLSEFDEISAIWIEAMADRGLEITPQDDGGMYVNVPFRPETDEMRTWLWGLNNPELVAG